MGEATKEPAAKGGLRDDCVDLRLLFLDTSTAPHWVTESYRVESRRVG